MNSTEPHNITAESIFKELLAGVNVFLTGPGGSGKTYTTAQILAMADAHHIPVIRTATTGVAALNLEEGGTLHSNMALPVNDVPTLNQWISMCRATAKSGEDYIRRLVSQARSARVLLVDEISMCSAWLFEYLDIRMRIWREELDRPFGGVTLLLVGDFLQLAPVYNPKAVPCPHPRSQLYAFESAFWHSDWADVQTRELKIMHRQQDTGFADLCNALRLGTPLTAAQTVALRGRVVNTKPTADTMSIMIKRDDVFARNKEALHLLDSPPVSVKFPMDTIGSWSDDMLKTLVRDVRNSLYIPHNQNSQCFKVGAKVMLVVNAKMKPNPFDDTTVAYVNGDRGTVVGFVSSNYGTNVQRQSCLMPYEDHMLLSHSEGTCPVVEFERTDAHIVVNPHMFERSIKGASKDLKTCTVLAIPLCLAWNSTVHKVWSAPCLVVCSLYIFTCVCVHRCKAPPSLAKYIWMPT